MMAFMLCGAAICMDSRVGMLFQPSAEVLFGLLNWLASAVRLHLYFHWPQYDFHKDAISRSFLWGVLILGSYGVYQFFVLRNGTAIGSIMSSQQAQVLTLEPLQVRVFSAVNSPDLSPIS